MRKKIWIYSLIIALIALVVGAVIMIRHRLYLVSRDETVREMRLNVQQIPDGNRWNIQSIDTMKESRDRARAKLNDNSYDEEIERQVRNISKTGANFIAVDTPYDEEFFPFLERWVRIARRYDLHVWFRGNWSGWEGWFDYSKTLSREGHIQKTKNFITDHTDIFRNGDIFSPCPECENGGPGDPRATHDVFGYRAFILNEYERSLAAFSNIGKNVQVLFPSNLDVAKLVFDSETTQKLGGVVAIDHYINDPSKMVSDISDIARRSGGRVVLGEFGIPLDPRSSMTDRDQVDWIQEVLRSVSNLDEIEGVNYWINTGGPTELWRKNGEARESVSVIREYFMPRILYGKVTDDHFCPIANAHISIAGEDALSRSDGAYEIRNIDAPSTHVSISADGFFENFGTVSFEYIRIVKKDVILKRKESGSARLFSGGYFLMSADKYGCGIRRLSCGESEVNFSI